jgi:hypothetical protein
MTASRQPLEWVIRMGPSTKVTTLSTGERIRFTREALDSAVESAKGKYLPQSIEHLTFLPPIGRIVDVWVQDEDDASYLYARAEAARAGVAGDITLRQQPCVPSAPVGDVAAELILAYEPRNFGEADQTVIEADAPVPVRHHSMHSHLPPLIWSVLIGGPVAWASKSFFDAFLRQLGDGLGAALSDWLVRSSRRAKDGHRTNLVECRFSTQAGVNVVAICPFEPESGPQIQQLREGLNALGDVATFCRTVDEGMQPDEMRAATFYWDGSNWRLAWWASDEGVFVTPWFQKNMPDPEQFLGRPLEVGLDALDYMLGRGTASVGGLTLDSAPSDENSDQSDPPSV